MPTPHTYLTLAEIFRAILDEELRVADDRDPAVAPALDRAVVRLVAAVEDLYPR